MNQMGHGGKRPGAGRKRGSLSRKTTEVAQQAVEQGVTPLEVMLAAMRSHYDAGDLDGAAAIAKDAAPYMHPRLSAVAVTGQDGGAIVHLHLVEEIVGHVSDRDGPSAHCQAAPGPG